jgi:hypothetical protein
MRNKSLAFITALGLLGCDGGPGSSDIDPAEANLGNQRSGNHLIDKVKVFSGNCDALLVEYQPEKGDETKEASPGWWF